MEMTEKPGFAEKFWRAAQNSYCPCLWVHGLNSSWNVPNPKPAGMEQIRPWPNGWEPA